MARLRAVRTNGARGRIVRIGLALACLAVAPLSAVHAGAIAPTTISGSATDVIACTQTNDPPLLPPSTVILSVASSTDASPEPHGGNLITLSNTTVTFTFPGAFIQAGVGVFLHDGSVLPAVIDPVLAASNTSEATHAYSVASAATVHVLGGIAQPLSWTASLPNTTWHPIDGHKPVVVTEQSVQTSTALVLGTQTLTTTFACTPSAPSPIVTIDGRAPTIAPGAASVSEGSSGTTAVQIPVALSAASAQTVTVQWRTVYVPGAPAGQADPATDYTPASGTLTFAPGDTSKSVAVSVKGDTLVEPDEYIVVQFGNPTNASMGGFWGLGFAGIINDD
jgi:Calx-beta domain